MKKYLIIPIALIGLAACNKTRDDFSGQAKITGEVYFIDPFQGDGKEKALAGEKVYIQYHGGNADSINYLYYTTTDADGKFVFTNLGADNGSPEYRIYVKNEFTEATQAYVADTVVSKSDLGKGAEVKIKLVARFDSTRQNALALTTRDAFGGYLPGADVHIFTSRLLATLDTAKLQGNGAAYKLKSDSLGRIFKTGISADTLYINAKLDIDTVQFRTYLHVIPTRGRQFILDSLKMQLAN